MTQIEQKKFQNILQQRQTDLAANGNRGWEVLTIDASADELDRIQHAQDRDLAIGSLDRNAKQLREVQAALNRIDAGEFGVCLTCEEDISVKRLAAVPSTSLCIACQETADTTTLQPERMTEGVLASAG
jgi:DnaK suppressor protein